MKKLATFFKTLRNIFEVSSYKIMILNSKMYDKNLYVSSQKTFLTIRTKNMESKNNAKLFLYVVLQCQRFSGKHSKTTQRDG